MLTITVFAILLLSLAAAVEAAHNSGPKRISAAREHVVQTLDRGLYGTPMAWTGRELEAAGWKWHVSPYFIAAIAGTESSFGAAHCTQSRYWIFGLGSCGRSWTPPYWQSWRGAYDYFARFLWDRWISRGARSATSIGYTFCPPCGARWGAKVEEHMRALFGVGSGVRYP